jgi:CO/xanthine dehydrogenase FAD-binding subunit
MMVPPFDYKTPRTLSDACALLWNFREQAKIIAGGTDLIIGLRQGELHPRLLIDITQIPEIQEIRETTEFLSIGAGVTHSRIAASDLVQTYGRVLAEAASWIGSPQIRNLGTLGGNLVNASPAADTIPPLMVLGATGRILSKDGEKEVPLADLFKSPYRTHLAPHEILTEIKFPKLSPSFRSGFVRLARREAMAVARMNVAVVLSMEHGRIGAIRISVGSVTPVPQRMEEAESLLLGASPDEELFTEAGRKISGTMIRMSGIRPSTSYKKPVVEALFLRAVRQALEGSI